MAFPVAIYRYESCTIKKAEHWRIDAFELWCWRRLFRVPWTSRRSNKSILQEINPEYSMEGLMLKVQYLGHLMLRADSPEKTWMLGKIEGRRRRGWQRKRWLDDINGHDWANSGRLWRMEEPGVLQTRGSQRADVTSGWTPPPPPPTAGFWPRNSWAETLTSAHQLRVPGQATTASETHGVHLYTQQQKPSHLQGLCAGSDGQRARRAQEQAWVTARLTPHTGNANGQQQATTDSRTQTVWGTETPLLTHELDAKTEVHRDTWAENGLKKYTHPRVVRGRRGTLDLTLSYTRITWVTLNSERSASVFWDKTNKLQERWEATDNLEICPVLLFLLLEASFKAVALKVWSVDPWGHPRTSLRSTRSKLFS